MIDRFHSIELVAAREARVTVFYRDLLGLELLARDGEAGAGGSGSGEVRLRFGSNGGEPGTLVTVRVRPGAGRGRWGVGGVHHVALGVATQAAQLMWKRRLEDAGVVVTGPYDRRWFEGIYFTDPDGQVVEIATAGPGYGVDEPLDALGQVVVDPGEERLRGNRDEAGIRARTHPDPVPEVTSAMALRGIHHITGLTDGAARAEDFYGALGLRVVKRTVNQDDGETPHIFWARYDGEEVGPHSAWTLFEWKGSDYRARPGTGQTERVLFHAPDAEALEAVRDRLLGMGVEVSAMPGSATGVRFRAPDGQPLGVVTGT